MHVFLFLQATTDANSAPSLLPVEAAANATAPALAKGAARSGELGTDGDGELSDEDDSNNSSSSGHQRKQKAKRSNRKVVNGNAPAAAVAATTATARVDNKPQNPTSPNDNARVEQPKLHVVRVKPYFFRL